MVTLDHRKKEAALTNVDLMVERLVLADNTYMNLNDQQINGLGVAQIEQLMFPYRKLHELAAW